MSTTTKSNYKSFIIFAVLMILGIGLRFYQLDRTLGGGDENQYLLDYGDASLKEVVTTYFYGGHPVFHTLLMRLMIMGFGGENAIAVRLPAFLAGIACLWLVYRVALQLFDSPFIARLALLIATICPIHIFYSQTARGYSLIMFFSIAMVYAALKILDSNKTLWAFIFVLCGVLSVYTVVTNVYFMAALAVWLFAILLLPPWKKEYATLSPRNKAFAFLVMFLLMAVLSYLLYLPLIDKVIEEGKNYHLAHELETSKLVITGKILTGTLTFIFSGLLIWFLPFLVVGILCGDTARRSYRLLPISIFFLPLIVPLLTGVGGYPRNYLYNLPILVIFLAAGMVKAGDFLSHRLPLLHIGRSFCFIIISLYVLISFKILITEHYPSLKIPDGKLYQKLLRENSKSFDLIVIADSGNYLYAKSIYQQNLKNIFLLNKLSGIKLIASSPAQIENFALPDGRSLFPLLKGFFNLNNLQFLGLAEERKLFTLSRENTTSLLPEDFEIKTSWFTLSGNGNISGERLRKVTGAQSMLVEGRTEENFIITTTLPNKIITKKPSMVVFLWSGKVVKNPKSAELFVPALVVRGESQENNTYQLQLGKINDGVQTEIQSAQGNGVSDKWAIESFIGKIMPGEYTISIQLNVPSSQAVLYDGFRLFIIEVAN